MTEPDIGDIKTWLTKEERLVVKSLENHLKKALVRISEIEAQLREAESLSRDIQDELEEVQWELEAVKAE